MPPTVVHVVGARPQFVKAAVVLEATQDRWQDVLVHTGQHYDHALSEIFFEELGIPHADINLNVGSGTHATQTAEMMTRFEQTLAEMRPGAVVVYGDTNSTLAGALVATKLGWPVVHVEAGLRSFDRAMPEEVNRIAVDHVSDLLLCPTQRAMEQLSREGLGSRAHHTGDVMLDVALKNRERARTQSRCGPRLFTGEGRIPDPLLAVPEVALAPQRYALATVHRAANTDDPARLKAIIGVLGELEQTVILPLHPRTRAVLDREGISAQGDLQCIEPVGYLDFAALIANAAHVLTDSGGVQKEALFHGVPCTTMRDTTEWPETLEAGWNVLADADPDAIRRSFFRNRPDGAPPIAHFGGGHAADAVADVVSDFLEQF